MEYRILIVDDDSAHLNTLAQVLEGQFDVVTAEDGKRAAEMLPTLDQNLVIVLSDLDMPHMNGIELLTIVRETRPEVRRVLMTAQVGTGRLDAHALQILSPSLLIPKPINDIKRLRRDLLGLLER